MSNFGYRKELKKEEVDEENLLASLTNEELQELERAIAEMYPDDTIPIGLRQLDQTIKPPTGHFCSEALSKHMQSETHGLTKMKKEELTPQQGSIDESKTDKSKEKCLSKTDTKSSHLDDNKKKEEPQKSKYDSLKDIKIYNQMKPSQQDCKEKDSKEHSRGQVMGNKRRNWDQVALDNVIPEGSSRNSTDIDRILEKILRNDETVSEVNLNNAENICQSMLISFAEALSTNTHVRVFSLANTHADDQVAFALAKMIKINSCITSLNIESNFISGKGILALVRSLQQNTSLVELRFHNQRHICGGQVEMEIVGLLRENTTLLKLGYQFDLPGPRMSATSILTRNQDHRRKMRLQQRQVEKSEETMGHKAFSEKMAH